MIQRKIALLVLALLLISVGLAAAGSSTNYSVQRFVLSGGGTANSANYQVTTVIGQPAAGIANSSNYQVTAGFLSPPAFPYGVWLPLINK